MSEHDGEGEVDQDGKILRKSDRYVDLRGSSRPGEYTSRKGQGQGKPFLIVLHLNLGQIILHFTRCLVLSWEENDHLIAQ